MPSETKIRSWCAIIDYNTIIRVGVSAVENEISQDFMGIPIKERTTLMRAIRGLIDKQVMVALAQRSKIILEGMDAALTEELNIISIILDEAGIRGIANDVMCRIIKSHIEEAVNSKFP